MTTSKVGIWNRALSRIGETVPVESETEDNTAARSCQLHYDDCLREVLESFAWPWARRQAILTDISTQTYNWAGDGSEKDFNIPYPYRDASSVTIYLVDNAGTAAELTAGTDYTTTVPADGGTHYITLTGDAPAADEFLRVTVTTAFEGWEYVYTLPADCVTVLDIVIEDTRNAQVNPVSRPNYALQANMAGDGWLLCCDYAADDFVLEYIALFSYVPAMPASFISALAYRLASELALAINKDRKQSLELLQLYDMAIHEAASRSYNQDREAEPDPVSYNERG
jgi:hypothetical protein